ncbi:related to short chain dehydrogenase [Ramularia collo-cygni]|uniref:Related to short chain dehydrogenase n=1 Tax=Ramularia collo-cygni TaxID=112498 RepID=A0A2D3VBD9_9PEZI|nr:related to short chain dehydrogenase [Ramularia collo-cygni]CZT25403.1 related to short chain dehydrogenase [Ramularia collo-cygni]
MVSRILITGSSDGIGLAAAKLLSEQGHKVTLHARNQDRANQAKSLVPKAEGVLIGDLTSIASTENLAAEANAKGPWDTVVHNAGIGLSGTEGQTEDAMAKTFQVNSLAPYILTSLMERPKRLLYVSSGLHTGGDESLKDVTWKDRPFQPSQAYSDTKLHNVLLANAVARHWTDVQSCALDPGWVKTKLAGDGAPGTTSSPAKAIAAFAAGRSDAVGDQTGVYFAASRGSISPHKATLREDKQEEYLRICSHLSGVEFPR